MITYGIGLASGKIINKMNTDLMLACVEALTKDLMRGNVTIIQALEYAYKEGHDNYEVIDKE